MATISTDTYIGKEEIYLHLDTALIYFAMLNFLKCGRMYQR